MPTSLEDLDVEFLLRLAGRLRAESKQLREALVEARPYVFQRIFPPGHPDRDWRSETAESILVRVDEALGKQPE